MAALLADRPWLANDAWQMATIRSSSKAAMYTTWGFAGIWNLISAPLPFVMYKEVVEKENWFRRTQNVWVCAAITLGVLLVAFQFKRERP